MGFVSDKMAKHGKSLALARLAEARLRKLNALNPAAYTESLMDLIPRVTPAYDSPKPLLPLVSMIERTATERVFGVGATPPQHGKAIYDGELMLTRRGWLRTGDVVRGDYLVGSDGGWTEVVGVFPQGDVPLSRCRFSDGSTLTTCGEHRWQVHNRYSGKATIKTTAELASDLFEADDRAKWRIPVVAPLAGEDTELPLEPYLLGAWLGDGTSSRSEITTMDPEIVQAIRDAGYRTSYEYNAGRATTYGIVGGMLTTLKGAILLNNKHVPACYFNAPPAVRLALLQGLCDTDGTVAKNGGQQSYCSTSPQLAADFKCLVNELGGVWTEYVRPAAAKLSYTISFRLPHGMPGFRLPRKAGRINPDNARNVPRRFFHAVEPAGHGHATCFQVAADDHLFCAGRDLVVTHNTEAVMHALLWLTMKRPGKQNVYATYSQGRARSVSDKCRRLFDRAGIRVEGTKDKWYMPDTETSIIWTSVGGMLTGEPIDGVLFIDDPYKDRREACSPVTQAHRMDWFDDVADTRLNPGSSVIVIMARWDANDMSGQLLKRPNPTGAPWEHCNLKAIYEGDGPEGDAREVGDALWPGRKPLSELLQKQQTNAYSFASLYQGAPRPRGGALFKEPMYYNDLPRQGYRVGLGADLAYSKKTSADFSCLAEVWRDGDDFYLVDMIRAQVEAPSFVLPMRRKAAQYPGVGIHWYAAGTEKGAADFIREKNVPLVVINPPGDKYSRALATAEMWNNNTGEGPRLMVPSPEFADRNGLNWVDDCVYEVTSFTGVNDPHDDQVDTLVSACDALNQDDEMGITGSRSNRR